VHIDTNSIYWSYAGKSIYNGPLGSYFNECNFWSIKTNNHHSAWACPWKNEVTHDTCNEPHINCNVSMMMANLVDHTYQTLGVNGYLIHTSQNGNEILSVKGSVTMNDWLENFSSKVIQVNIKGLMVNLHEGFFQKYIKLIRDDEYTRWHERCSQVKWVNCFITGHSQGAAVASIMALHLNEPSLRLYTFGLPNFINERNINLDVYAYHNIKLDNDLVTTVPYTLSKLKSIETEYFLESLEFSEQIKLKTTLCILILYLTFSLYRNVLWSVNWISGNITMRLMIWFIIFNAGTCVILTNSYDALLEKNLYALLLLFIFKLLLSTHKKFRTVLLILISSIITYHWLSINHFIDILALILNNGINNHYMMNYKNKISKICENDKVF